MSQESTENQEAQEIPKRDLFTPLEHEFIGSTAEEGDWPSDVPIAVSKGVSIRVVSDQREQRLSKYRSSLGYTLGYGKMVVIRFPDLDPITGTVTDEPRFIGFWNNKKREVELAENPNALDREIKEKWVKLKDK